MTSRYKSILFAISLLFLAGAISSPCAYAGSRIIFDGIPTVTDCLICHDDLERFPVLEDSDITLHHNLIDTVIPELYESTAPDAPNAVPGEVYECLSCHDFVTGFSDFRDCLQCHPVWIVTGSPGRGDNVHHDGMSGSDSCIICHGD